MKRRIRLSMACCMAALLLFITLSSFAQDGIKFEHGLSWQEVKEKAKRENKYIFMDCFTTWCGPCKMMSNNIFPQKEVGDVFNEKFINVKVQMDKTDKDNEEVKGWYADAAAIAKEYSVMAYPTFLYFSPEGKLVHLYVGATKEPREFIEKSSQAFDASTQYFTKMEAAVKSAGNNPDAIRELALEAKKNYDGVNSSALANEYLKLRKDVYTKEHLAFIDEFTRKSTDIGFSTFVKHANKVDAVMGKGFSQKKLSQIVFQESGAYDAMRDKSEPDFKAIEQKIRAIVPDQTDVMMARLNIHFLSAAKKHDEYLKAVPAFIKKYDKQVYPEELGGYARQVFNFSKDPAAQQQALGWSKKAATESETAENLATYATLLYKSGKKNEAIAFQKKAVAKCDQEDEKEYMLKYYTETLVKMEKGEMK